MLCWRVAAKSLDRGSPTPEFDLLTAPSDQCIDGGNDRLSLAALVPRQISACVFNGSVQHRL